ncbi:11-beta-hydroxysteroid dehydrogenase 1b, partial [Quercus suber]
HLAYEYAKRGALLALIARRENALQEVANQAREYGSPDVLIISADVSKVEDGKRIDINFWGSVYTTHLALPHLRESRGKMIVLASSSWLPTPRMSFYNASSAAIVSFFETLRVEVGPEIKITIVTPEFIESEMTPGKFLLKEGKMEVDQDLRDEMDHLVNNAGVIRVDLFEDSTDIASVMASKAAQICFFESLRAEFGPDIGITIVTPGVIESEMTQGQFLPKDINFWGSVYSTHYAVPHLRKSKGKIVVISSVAAWFCTPRLSFYNASKAAQKCFFESVRAEFGPDIGITIVTPGVTESEMTQGQFLPKIEMPWMPVESTERCAKAIVDSTCKGDMYLTKPSWMRVGFWMRVLCPEVFEWCLHSMLVKRPCSTRQNEDR